MVGWPHRLDGHEFEQALGDREASGRTGKPSMLQSMGSQSQTRLSNWTTNNVGHLKGRDPAFLFFEE